MARNVALFFALGCTFACRSPSWGNSTRAGAPNGHDELPGVHFALPSSHVELQLADNSVIVTSVSPAPGLVQGKEIAVPHGELQSAESGTAAKLSFDAERGEPAHQGNVSPSEPHTASYGTGEPRPGNGEAQPVSLAASGGAGVGEIQAKKPKPPPPPPPAKKKKPPAPGQNNSLTARGASPAALARLDTKNLDGEVEKAEKIVQMANGAIPEVPSLQEGVADEKFISVLNERPQVEERRVQKDVSGGAPKGSPPGDAKNNAASTTDLFDAATRQRLIIGYRRCKQLHQDVLEGRFLTVANSEDYKELLAIVDQQQFKKACTEKVDDKAGSPTKYQAAHDNAQSDMKKVYEFLYLMLNTPCSETQTLAGDVLAQARKDQEEFLSDVQEGGGPKGRLVRLQGAFESASPFTLLANTLETAVLYFAATFEADLAKQIGLDGNDQRTTAFDKLRNALLKAGETPPLPEEQYLVIAPLLYVFKFFLQDSLKVPPGSGITARDKADTKFFPMLSDLFFIFMEQHVVEPPSQTYFDKMNQLCQPILTYIGADKQIIEKSDALDGISKEVDAHIKKRKGEVEKIKKHIRAKECTEADEASAHCVGLPAPAGDTEQPGGTDECHEEGIQKVLQDAVDEVERKDAHLEVQVNTVAKAVPTQLVKATGSISRSLFEKYEQTHGVDSFRKTTEYNSVVQSFNADQEDEPCGTKFQFAMTFHDYYFVRCLQRFCKKVEAEKLAEPAAVQRFHPLDKKVKGVTPRSPRRGKALASSPSSASVTSASSPRSSPASTSDLQFFPVTGRAPTVIENGAGDKMDGKTLPD